MIVEKSAKIRKIFECEICDYVTSDKKDYAKHLSTRKHKMVVNGSKMVVENPQNEIHCICGKSYKHDSGYYRHKKTCTFVEEKEEDIKSKETLKTGSNFRKYFIHSITGSIKYKHGIKLIFQNKDMDGYLYFHSCSLCFFLFIHFQVLTTNIYNILSKIKFFLG